MSGKKKSVFWGLYNVTYASNKYFLQIDKYYTFDAKASVFINPKSLSDYTQNLLLIIKSTLVSRPENKIKQNKKKNPTISKNLIGYWFAIILHLIS